ncbi:MAG TPA: MarR family transcriptional regulator [Solirubrobacteraceae bacterium]
MSTAADPSPAGAVADVFGADPDRRLDAVPADRDRRLDAVPADRDRLIDDVRAALSELLGAERRLRGRDQHRDGLTYAQLRALTALRDGERTAGALAEAANCNPASTTAMLDHLEASGVIERRRDTRDRRVCLVALTGEGRRLLEQKRAGSQKIWQERFGAAPGTDLEAAARAMRTIAEMLDAH